MPGAAGVTKTTEKHREEVRKEKKTPWLPRRDLKFIEIYHGRATYGCLSDKYRGTGADKGWERSEIEELMAEIVAGWKIKNPEGRGSSRKVDYNLSEGDLYEKIVNNTTWLKTNGPFNAVFRRILSHIRF